MIESITIPSPKPQGYRKHRKMKCEACGFVPISANQMDVHHKDHNRNNNHPDNLETLCANCHRLYHSNPDYIVPVDDYSALVKKTLELEREIRRIDRMWCYSI